jgi:hypothetical protein
VHLLIWIRKRKQKAICYFEEFSKSMPQISGSYNIGMFGRAVIAKTTICYRNSL